MTNAYFATALVGVNRVGVTIRAQNIATAFEVAEHYFRTATPSRT
jgi:hypothetical protein